MKLSKQKIVLGLVAFLATFISCGTASATSVSYNVLNLDGSISNKSLSVNGTNLYIECDRISSTMSIWVDGDLKANDRIKADASGNCSNTQASLTAALKDNFNITSDGVPDHLLVSFKTDSSAYGIIHTSKMFYLENGPVTLSCNGDRLTIIASRGFSKENALLKGTPNLSATTVEKCENEMQAIAKRFTSVRSDWPVNIISSTNDGGSNSNGSSNGGYSEDVVDAWVGINDGAGNGKYSILTGCGEKANQSDGEGIKCVISLVIDIFSVGIGVLGVLGITIVGIQYLTSGGNEAQMTKAKRRLFEIVIGLVAYVLIYAFLKWISPSF